MNQNLPKCPPWCEEQPEHLGLHRAHLHTMLLPVESHPARAVSVNVVGAGVGETRCELVWTVADRDREVTMLLAWQSARQLASTMLDGARRYQ